MLSAFRNIFKLFLEDREIFDGNNSKKVVQLTQNFQEWNGGGGGGVDLKLHLYIFNETFPLVYLFKILNVFYNSYNF